MAIINLSDKGYDTTASLILGLDPNGFRERIKQADQEDRKVVTCVLERLKGADCAAWKGFQANPSVDDHYMNAYTSLILDMPVTQIKPISFWESIKRGFQNIFGSRIKSEKLVEQFKKAQSHLMTKLSLSLPGGDSGIAVERKIDAFVQTEIAFLNGKKDIRLLGENDAIEKSKALKGELNDVLKPLLKPELEFDNYAEFRAKLSLLKEGSDSKLKS